MPWYQGFAWEDIISDYIRKDGSRFPAVFSDGRYGRADR